MRSTSDAVAANMKHSALEMSLKVGSASSGNLTFRVPVMTSTRAIKVGEELLVHKPTTVEQNRALKKRASEEAAAEAEKQKKLQKTGATSAKGRGKGKGRR